VLANHGQDLEWAGRSNVKAGEELGIGPSNVKENEKRRGLTWGKGRLNISEKSKRKELGGNSK